MPFTTILHTVIPDCSSGIRNREFCNIRNLPFTWHFSLSVCYDIMKCLSIFGDHFPKFLTNRKYHTTSRQQRPQTPTQPQSLTISNTHATPRTDGSIAETLFLCQVARRLISLPTLFLPLALFTYG